MHERASIAVSSDGQNKIEDKEREKSNCQAELITFAWFLETNQRPLLILSKDIHKKHYKDIQLFS